MGVIRERTDRALNLILPGDPQTRTGGYIYDRRIVEGMRRLGWRVIVHSLDTVLPSSSAVSKQADLIFSRIPDGSITVIDGLALPALSDTLEQESRRHRLIGLVHHPVSLETGLKGATAGLLRERERKSLTCVRGVIVTSGWTAKTLHGFGVSADRVRIVEPGVEARPRKRNSSVPRAAWRLLCVATLTPRKGHAVLFDALARIRDRHWVLHCVGSFTRDPATTNELKQQIDRLSMQDRIVLLGEVDDDALEREYAETDLFVLASHMEGYGMVLADAIGCGIPVISTMAGAIPDTIRSDAAILVAPDDHRALAAALADFMDNHQTRVRLAAGAFAASASFPSWQDAAVRFAAALTALTEDEA